METYLTLLYVTLEQEIALKEFFASKGWMYFKPDLNVMTERVGPFEIPTVHKIATKDLASCNSSRCTKAIARSNVSQKATIKSDGTSKVSSAFVVKDIDESRVKIEISGVLDDNNDVDDSYMEENIDDGDNDDDFADSIHLDASVENNSTIHGFVNDTINNTDICAVSKVDILKHSNTSFPNASDVDVENTLLMTGDKKNCVGDYSRNVLKKDLKNGQNIDSNNDLIISLTSAAQSAEAENKKSRQQVHKCPQCDILVSKNSFERHMMSHLKQGTSSEVLGKFQTHENLTQENDESGYLLQHSCMYCGVNYKSRRSLKEHILTKHEKGSAKWYQCNVCGIKKSRKHHLRDHMNIHYNTNPYCCENCGRSYKVKSSYNRHIRECGSENKHGCEICGQMYKTSTGVIEHIKRCHDQQQAFKCECGLEFKSRSSRWKHRGFCDQYQSHKRNKMMENSGSTTNNAVEVTLSLNKETENPVYSDDTRLDIPSTCTSKIDAPLN